jgi:DNA-binding transcriptional ArsR family regulator
MGTTTDLDRPADVLELASVLAALADPVRLLILAALAEHGEVRCGGLELPVTKSTASHHFRVLREAGLIETRIEGKHRINSLRRDALDEQFPGLLDAVLEGAVLEGGAQAGGGEEPTDQR